MRIPLVVALACSSLSATELTGVSVTVKPYAFMTDVGANPTEQKATLARFGKPLLETAQNFLATYNLKQTCFEDYAAYYDRPDSHFDPLIRIRIWRNFDDFLADYQRRYQTKSIPGAFFGISEQLDAYGKKTGTWTREIGIATEGEDDMTVLRSLYHEMGHLFMRTFIVHQVEVPSWIEEGTAEHFEYRIGNGTKPDAERDQRLGWLREMIEEDKTIPWPEMINVHNLDNLDFTYKDPVRSTVQYVQAWSMIQFMLSNDLRRSAYVTMLQKFKTMADVREVELSGVTRDPEEFHRLYEPYLYEIQESVFLKCYGAKLVDVEQQWKDWIKKSYETELKKKPILAYHRGDWYMMHAEHPGKGETAEQLLAKAAKIFDECVKKSPDKPEGWVGQGRLALVRGDIKSAGEQFDKALTLGATSFDALLYAGIARLRDGHAKDAIAPLAKAAADRPTDADAQLALGQSLAAGGGDAKEALKHLSAARDLDHERAPWCAFIEGCVQYREADMHGAYISWLRVANLQPGFEGIELYQALAKAESNLRDEAIDLLKPIAETDAGSDLAHIISDTELPLPKVVLGPDCTPNLDFTETRKALAKRARTHTAKPKPRSDAPSQNPALQGSDGQAAHLLGVDGDK
jgi:tetratricopeptide (TPR) repeat protein